MAGSLTYVAQTIDFSHPDDITIHGTIEMPEDVDTIDTATSLLVKKRKADDWFTVPLQYSNDEYWSAHIHLTDHTLSTGTWDYYIVMPDDQRYRLKAHEALDDESQTGRTLLFNHQNHTYEFGCYVTVKGSLSSTLYTPTTSLHHLKGEKLSDDVIRLTGTLPSNENADSQLIIKREHDMDIVQTIPLHSTEHNNQTAVVADISYSELVTEGTHRQKWDLYLNMDDKLFRIQLDNPDGQLDRSTSVEQHRESGLSLMYCYQTMYDNLSIKLAGMRIKRDITACDFTNDHLHVRGYAYFDLIPFEQPDSVKRSLVMRKRPTGQEQVFLIDNVSIDAMNDPYYQYAGFDIWMPLAAIDAMQANVMEIYSFTLRLEYGTHVQERGLGYETFSYLVDEPIASYSFYHYTRSHRCYLELTPGGNLKIEAYTYSRKKQRFLDKMLKQGPKAAKQDIWLIGERPDTAQDNGFHFFRYCRTHYPEKKIYYVIDEDSPDRQHLESLGNVILFGSMKHFKIAASASTFIGSHDVEYILPTKATDWPNYQYGTRVFLQHGVLGRKKVDYDKSYYKYPFNVFCVSSESESKVVTEQFGYHPDEVHITGLARFDQLIQKQQEMAADHPSILVMPTWRDWIKENTFLESDYFHHYKALLEDQRLYQLLEESGVKLSFYLHYRMQPYINYFKALANDHIDIIGFDETDVQSLLLAHQLLITDYSSVSFDFNFMDKPILFYHFDFDRFFKKGLLRPADETFLGEICEDRSSLIDAIDRSIQAGFKESPSVTKQKQTLFTHRDAHNNERIMDVIEKQHK